MKTKILALLFVVSLLNYTYAATLGNCKLSEKYDGLLEGVFKEKQEYGVLKKEDVEKALQNLNSYCCAKKYLDCSASSSNVPESPYLFDHLTDAGFRKLDAMDASLGYQPDDKAKEWREEIRKIAKKKEGEAPGNIYEKFTKARGVGGTDGLYHKYMETCSGIYDIMMQLPDIKSGYDVDYEESSMALKNCRIAATNRVNREMKYTEMIMMSKGAKYMEDNLKSYLNEYLSKKRMDTLIEKFKKYVGFFGRVAQKLNEGTSNCGG